jgi:hypothetical protein
MHRLSTSLAAAGALLAAGLLGPAPGALAQSPPIAFGTPTIVDPIHTFGEPTISVDQPTGEVFASGPTGTGTQRSAWEGSFDNGESFRVITPNAPPTAVQSFEDPPGGGDTDLNYDLSGKEYFIDLYALVCDRAATTSDGGATVTQGFDGCGTSPPSDRPWLAVYDPPKGTAHESAYHGPVPLVYEEYNNLTGPGPNGGAQWNKSTDGINYTNATNGVSPLTESTYSPFGPDGYPAIDQVTGKVFQAAGFPQPNGTYDLEMNIGTPDASGNLTFLDAPSTPGGGPDYSKLIHIADGLPASPDTLFTALSMDSARNLFVVWAVHDPTTPARDQVYVAASSAASGWRTWTAPVEVSNGSSATGDAVNVFPWIKAGGPGRADAVWYGSNMSVDPSSQSGQAWNVFMNQVVFPVNGEGQITGAAPAKTLVRVSPHPNHYNDICLEGSGCITSQGNRNLADFFTVSVDRSGAAEVIYDDTSNGLAQAGFTPTGNQTVDHVGAPVVTVARQDSGMGLYGTPVNRGVDFDGSAPVSGIFDRHGDARYPVIGGANVPGMDLQQSSLSLAGGKLTVTDYVTDLSNPTATMAAIPGAALLEYVTRWQMGNTIYYAEAVLGPGGIVQGAAGKAQSIDLCSVSACFPHVITYPEANLGGSSEPASISCPATPSVGHPCRLTITVNAADIGSPSASDLLEEVGTYSLASAHPQGLTTNAQAQADDVPLEIDGACCFNYREGARGIG